MANEVVILSGMMNFYKDGLNTMSKGGGSKFKAGFIVELKIVDVLMKAQVRASMKGKAYRTSLTFDGM